MQPVSSRIWTRVDVFISYDDNNYTTGVMIMKVHSAHLKRYCQSILRLAEWAILVEKVLELRKWRMLSLSDAKCATRVDCSIPNLTHLRIAGVISSLWPPPPTASDPIPSRPLTPIVMPSTSYLHLTHKHFQRLLCHWRLCGRERPCTYKTTVWCALLRNSLLQFFVKTCTCSHSALVPFFRRSTLSLVSCGTPKMLEVIQYRLILGVRNYMMC